MDTSTVVGLVLSSTLISGLISSLFTRRNHKESNEIDLLDRAYKEIERLDSKLEEKDRLIAELREEKQSEIIQ